MRFPDPPSHPEAGRPGAGAPRRRTRLGLAVLSLALTAWPFLVVVVPPLADLPQHAAQVRLVGEALEGNDAYRIQWATPYSLAYLPLALGQAVAGPLAGARLGAMVIALFWVGAVHGLAWRLGRSATAATAASVLVFHHALYWGFLPFLVGFPVFAAWFLLVRRRPRSGAGPGFAAGLAFAGLAVLLYAAHALWFAAGLGWLALDALHRLRRGTPWHQLVPRLTGPAILAVGAFAWFRSIAGTRFDTPPLWVPEPWRRLAPSSWVEAAFGGLRGNLEAVALAALLLWLVAAAWSGWRRRGRDTADALDPADTLDPAERWHRPLLILGLLFVAGALLLPDKYTNTIEFNDRWMPPGLALLLLAAPRIAVRPLLTRLAAGTLLAAFVMATAVTWQRAEEEELAGLMSALAALPAEPRVLGLDFPRTSQYLDRQPYLQTFAWSQVVHGGELNFSFADFPPSLVVYDPPRPVRWTPGLEWQPRRLRPGDFGWFTHVLVRGPEPLHRHFASQPFLEPATPPAPWVLYRVSEAAERTVVEPRRLPAPEAAPAPGSPPQGPL